VGPVTGLQSPVGPNETAISEWWEKRPALLRMNTYMMMRHQQRCWVSWRRGRSVARDWLANPVMRSRPLHTGTEIRARLSAAVRNLGEWATA
jgi:hypothetical protein